MEFLLLTKSTTFLIGPIAEVLGWIMNGIYNMGVHNVAMCIILFTVIVKPAPASSDDQAAEVYEDQCSHAAGTDCDSEKV